MENNRTNKVKNAIFVAIVIAFLISIIGGTYARYSSTGTANANADIAKWAIKLNQTDITLASETIEVQAVDVETSENVTAGKIAPGKTMKVELEVDPTGSEVAIDYMFSLDKENLKILSADGTELNVNPELRIDKVECTLPADNGTKTVKPKLDADDNVIYFESLDDVLKNRAMTCSIYFIWDDGDNTIDTQTGVTAQNVQVPVIVTARQHISGIEIGENFVTNLGNLEAGGTLQATQNIDFEEMYGTTLYNAMDFPDNATFDVGNKTIFSYNAGVSYLGDNLTIQNGKFTTHGNYAMFVGDERETSGITLKSIETTGGINIYNTQNCTLENVTSTAANYYSVWGDANCEITINSGTYIATSKTTALFGMSANGNSKGDFVINDGTFITNGKPFCLGGNYIPVVVYGGTFDCDVSEYVAEGKTIEKVNDTTWVVK